MAMFVNISKCISEHELTIEFLALSNLLMWVHLQYGVLSKF